MSEENPAPAPASEAEGADAAPADGPPPSAGEQGEAEEIDSAPVVVKISTAEVNGTAGRSDDVEMADAAAAQDINGDVAAMDNAAASAETLGATAAEPALTAEEQPARRTRSASFAGEEAPTGTASAESSDSAAPAPAAAAPAPGEEKKRVVPEATRVSARTANKTADREGENAMSSLLDAAEIRTTAVPLTSAGGPTGMSFLDSLTEEERRTRLRHVPGAEGFRGLHRSEVKRDLALARSILTGGTSGVIASSKGGRRSSDDGGLSAPKFDGMDVDDDGAMSDASEGELSSDTGSRRSGKDWVPTGPSPSFVPPVDTDPVPGSLSVKDASDPEGNKRKGTPKYPHIIESTVAFDPPRLPHSDAKNKSNRFKRWQAHPKEIEKDLEAYRKTVADTRGHLHKSERESERIENVGGHLRSHFLSHLRCLRDESLALERTLGVVQAKCVERAEVTKTRSTDAEGGFGAKAMNDVLIALKAKAGGAPNGVAPIDDMPWCTAGIGGLPASSEVEEKKEDDGYGDSSVLVSGWVLAGDSVKTPLGEGIVTVVTSPTLVEESNGVDLPLEKPQDAEEEEAAKDEAETKEKEAEAPKVHGFGAAPAPQSEEVGNKDSADKPAAEDKSGSDSADKPVAEDKSGSDSAKENGTKADDSAPSEKKDEAKTPSAPKKLKLIPAQARVRIASDSSIKTFALTELTLLEDPSTYSDEQLIERWTKMVESAKTVGCFSSVNAMDSINSIAANGSSSRATSTASSGGEGAMEVDEVEAQPEQQSSEDMKEKLDQYGIGYADLSKSKMSSNKVVPFGSDMLLTPGLKGASLAAIPFEKLEEYLDPMLFDGKGILGRHDNPGVSDDVKQMEAVRYELCTLKGRAHQLRNELHRQRRIRVLNERTRHVLDERAERVDGLLAEMKSDLITLKDRLGHELSELGMDQDQAAEVLAECIKEREQEQSAEVPVLPRKRSKAEPKPVPPPRISRRNKPGSSAEDNEDATSIKGDIPADDDSASRRKRNRSDESVDSGGPKPKRGAYRRQ